MIEITVNTSIKISSTQVITMVSTSRGTIPMTTDTPPGVVLGITAVTLFGLLATVTVVALLLLVYYKRKRSALVNLTKPHKGSEENSYASSEHSHQQGSKYSESPEPGYDVIKPRHTKDQKDKIILQKSSLLGMNPTHPFECASIEDKNGHYSEISSSHKTTSSHTCSCEYSAPSTKDNPSINFQKCNVFIADSESIEEDKDKQKQLTAEDVANGNNNSTKGEASPIPPQTIEMMYTAVQKKKNNLKVNTGMDSEFEDSTPPPPPQTIEMMYTAVQKRPKDSILAEVEDDALPVPLYMEKGDKETEATAKGSDEGSPPPVSPQTTEML